MIQIACPYCGPRDEAEFAYRGDATVHRPAEEAGFHDYVYARANPRGWHLEWWHHTGGCRAVLKVLRHTATHEVRAVGLPADRLEPPSA